MIVPLTLFMLSGIMKIKSKFYVHIKRRKEHNMEIYDLINQMMFEHKTIFDMPLRVTYYARVSTKSDAQQNSQANQVQTFTELIANNKNWTLVNGYVDTIRGESAANRENFLRMIKDGKKGKFDLIVCKEISRFSRDLLDSISYTRELLRNNVGVYFTSDNLCTIDRDAELRLGIMATIAQQEVARLSERVKFGHRKAIQNGVVLGNGRIYGYTKHDGKLFIDEKQAEIVREIFTLFSTGKYSLRQLETVLYEKGYRSLNGKQIKHRTISSIIQNPKYKGFYCGNKVKIADYRTKKQVFLPEEEWVMYKDDTGAIPAIVSEELWDRCNEIISKRTAEYKGNKSGVKYCSPLSGKIVCGIHNCSFHSVSRKYNTKQGEKEHRSWVCKEKHGDTTKCDTIYIPHRHLINVLGQYIKYISENVDVQVDKFIEIYREIVKSSDVASKIAEKEKQLEKLKHVKDKLFELYTDGNIPGVEFKERNQEIAEQTEAVRQELFDLNEKDKSEHAVENKIKELREFFATQFDVKTCMSEESVISFVETMVDKIVVYPVSKTKAKLVVVLNFGRQDGVEFEMLNNMLSSVSIIKKIGTQLNITLPLNNGHGIAHYVDYDLVVLCA